MVVYIFCSDRLTSSRQKYFSCLNKVLNSQPYLSCFLLIDLLVVERKLSLLCIKGKWSSILCLVVEVLERTHPLFLIPHTWAFPLDQKSDYRNCDKDSSL